MAGSQPLTAHPRQIARRECRLALVAQVVIRAWLARRVVFHFLPGDEMGTRPRHVLRGQEFAHSLTCYFFSREGGI